MKIVVITQARMTSTRLPGKILKKVQGKSLLEHQIERLQRIPSASQIVVATTNNGTEAPIIQLCEQLGINYYQGSENNVLSRYFEAAQLYDAEVVVRVTSDCPVIDPLIIEDVIQYYLQSYPQYKYVSNVLERTYPRGMDVEVFSFKVLQYAFKKANDPADLEHVTPFITRQLDHSKLKNVGFHKDYHNYRWTVDTKEDFQLVSKIINALYPEKNDFNLNDMLAILELNPEWADINAHIEQKKYGE